MHFSMNTNAKQSGVWFYKTVTNINSYGEGFVNTERVCSLTMFHNEVKTTF